jgi:hypothetical protein
MLRHGLILPDGCCRYEGSSGVQCPCVCVHILSSIEKTNGSEIINKLQDHNDRSFSKLSCISGPFLRLACSTRKFLLTTIGPSTRSSHRRFLVSSTDCLPFFVPCRALAVVNSVVSSTRCTLCNLGHTLINTVVARTFAASLWVWAPVFFIIVLLTLAASQRSLSLVKHVRERRFAPNVNNATTKKRFRIHLSGQVNSHGSISFCSAQPNNLLNLRSAVLVFEDPHEILSFCPGHLKHVFFLDIIQFNGKPLFALKSGSRQGI